MSSNPCFTSYFNWH